MTNLYIKRLRPDVILPTKAHDSDVGWDCYLPDDLKLSCVWGGSISQRVKIDRRTIPLGFSVQTDPGYRVALYLRSSAGYAGLCLPHGKGIIDPGYTGEVSLVVTNLNWNAIQLKAGDRICQLVVEVNPEVNLIEVDSFETTDRGSGGFGSSGR